MVTVVVTGINGWRSRAGACIESVRKYEPEVDIVVVDNGSKPPFSAGDYHLVRFCKTVCYARAMNNAMMHVKDWCIQLNDDVLCVGEFVEKVEALDRKTYYGSEIREKFLANTPFHYLNAWMQVFHRDLYDAIGPYDELYELAGVEDMDYGWRVERDGYAMQEIKLPFQHRRKATRIKMPNYKSTMNKNRERLIEKIHAWNNSSSG